MIKGEFEELIEKHEAVMYRVAYVYVRNRQDALDAVQEACYKAYMSFGRLKNPDYAGTWLVRITINCAVDLLRKRGRESPIPAEMTESIADISPSCEKQILERISIEQLMECLCTEEKRIVMLKYYCELTFTEIAKETGRPEGSVKTTLYRALNKLRNHISEVDNT